MKKADLMEMVGKHVGVSFVDGAMAKGRLVYITENRIWLQSCLGTFVYTTSRILRCWERSKND